MGSAGNRPRFLQRNNGASMTRITLVSQDQTTVYVSAEDKDEYYAMAALFVFEEMERTTVEDIQFDREPCGKDVAGLVYGIIAQMKARNAVHIESLMRPMRQYIVWYESGNCTGKLTDFESYRAYEQSRIRMGTFCLDIDGKVVVSKPLWWKYLTGETE